MLLKKGKTLKTNKQPCLSHKRLSDSKVTLCKPFLLVTMGLPLILLSFLSGLTRIPSPRICLPFPWGSLMKFFPGATAAPGVPAVLALAGLILKFCCFPCWYHQSCLRMEKESFPSSIYGFVFGSQGALSVFLHWLE